jgi:hypothetical protein
MNCGKCKRPMAAEGELVYRLFPNVWDGLRTSCAQCEVAATKFQPRLQLRSWLPALTMRALLAPGVSRSRAQERILFRLQRRVSAGNPQRQRSTQISAIPHGAAMRRLWRRLHSETRRRQVLLVDAQTARLSSGI